MDDYLKLIKDKILSIAKKHNINVHKIILFGSRARGDFRKSSDWDIMVVTEKRLNWKERNEFYADISWELTNDITAEIIIVDKENFEKYRDLPGYVYYWAREEGVLIK